MKSKLLLLILPLLLSATHSKAAAISDATGNNPCPTGFTFSVDEKTKKKCCSLQVQCPNENFEISQDCSVSGTPANSVSLKFCCKKKIIPFDCPKPAEVVMLLPEMCKKLNGFSDPNATNLNEPAKCCFNCAKAGIGYAWLQGTTSAEKCQPVPPNFFFPYPGSKEGRCCAKTVQSSYECKKPSEEIDLSLNNLTADHCKKYGGQINPNNKNLCCVSCTNNTALPGFSLFENISARSCMPRPPRVFIPDPTVPTRGKCCSRENPNPTFSCLDPNHIVTMNSTDCNLLGGTVNPTNTEQCCISCKNPKGWQDVRKEDCPSPPNYSYPAASFPGHVNCCYRDGVITTTSETETVTSTSSSTVTTTTSSSSLGVCQIAQGCVVSTNADGIQSCVKSGTTDPCASPVYIWNTNNGSLCCRNAQP